jgi:hypothetical protein
MPVAQMEVVRSKEERRPVRDSLEAMSIANRSLCSVAYTKSRVGQRGDEAG